MRFHDLPHSGASQCLADEHDMFDVSRWMAHHSIAFTDAVYAHGANEPDLTAAIERAGRPRGL